MSQQLIRTIYVVLAVIASVMAASPLITAVLLDGRF